MKYMSLYRKYRPVDFNSVYGQEEVVTVIKNAIVSGKVSHAYLFCGPRGTGKTTIAKIIARLVNCENLVDGNPCGKCYNCLNYLNSNDIVEIDGVLYSRTGNITEITYSVEQKQYLDYTALKFDTVEETKEYLSTLLPNIQRL